MDFDIRSLDQRLASLAAKRRLDSESLTRLTDRIVAASVSQLPAPAPLAFSIRSTSGATGQRRWMVPGLGTLAASIMLVLSMWMVLGDTGGNDARDHLTGTVATTDVAPPLLGDAPATEVVLVALLEENSKQARPGPLMTANRVSQASAVMTTRQASYDDFAAEIEAILGESTAQIW